MISVNTNMMAANTANTLNSHYSQLAKSTQRLSSGLRINSAADDAAGLAIRELMRSQVSALQQGMRNVNDAISMIQTFDGALGVIDEKLIRMKELAEQAATGTYDSTQRLMIDSEFQAMGEEINRIARATDFNGIKLIDGGAVAKMKTANAHVDAGIVAFSQDSQDGKFIYDATVTPNVTGTDVTGDNTDLLAGLTNLEALGEGTHTITLSNSNVVTGGPNNDYVFHFTTLGNNANFLNSSVQLSYDPANIAVNGNGWSIGGLQPNDFIVQTAGNQHTFLFNPTNVPDMDPFMVSITNPDGSAVNSLDAFSPVTWNPATNSQPKFNVSSNNPNLATVTPTATFDQINRKLTLELDLGNGNKINQTFSYNSQSASDLTSLSYTINVTKKPNPNQPTPPTPPTPGGDPNNPGGDPNNPNRPTGPIDPGLTPEDPQHPDYVIPDDVVRIHFGDGANHKEDFYDIRRYDATLNGLGLAGVNIQTQDSAQEALVTINDAIVTKDKIRADYGALQNRLENTFTNLSTQAENIKSAESRLSDAEVASEMTAFVKNQILTQAAIAMLAQANSMPQMVTRLING